MAMTPSRAAPGFDDINGNKGENTIDGGSAGGDWLVGGQGNDLITAHSSDNIPYGNLGNDTLIGGSGNDVNRGGQGDDSIVGGSGNDFISGAKSFRSLTAARSILTNRTVRPRLAIWCGRPGSNRHGVTPNGFSYHFGFRRRCPLT
jgi:Ca2+-binding RTX toxin-like protein